MVVTAKSWNRHSHCNLAGSWTPAFWCTQSHWLSIWLNLNLFKLIEMELEVLDVVPPTPAASGYTQVIDTSEVVWLLSGVFFNLTFLFKKDFHRGWLHHRIWLCQWVNNNTYCGWSELGEPWKSTRHVFIPDVQSVWCSGKKSLLRGKKIDIRLHSTFWITTWLINLLRHGRIMVRTLVNVRTYKHCLDFGKPNCTSDDNMYNASLVALWKLASSDQTSFLIQYEFGNDVSKSAGCIWAMLIFFIN